MLHRYRKGKIRKLIFATVQQKYSTVFKQSCRYHCFFLENETQTLNVFVETPPITTEFSLLGVTLVRLSILNSRHCDTAKR